MRPWPLVLALELLLNLCGAAWGPGEALGEHRAEQRAKRLGSVPGADGFARDSRLRVRRKGAGGGAGAGGVGTSGGAGDEGVAAPFPPYVEPAALAATSLTRNDPRVAATTDTRGNLGPASVIVQAKPGTDWYTRTGIHAQRSGKRPKSVRNFHWYFRS